MIPRFRLGVRSLLLTSTALLTIAEWPAAIAASDAPFVVAQAAPEGQKPAQPAPDAPKQQPAAKPPAPPAPPQARPQQAPPAPQAQPQQRPAAPVVQEQRQERREQREERREQRREERSSERPAPAPTTQQQQQRTPPAAQQPAPPPPAAQEQRPPQDQRQERREERREGRDERREERRDERRRQQAPAATQQQPPQPAPSTAQPQRRDAPSATQAPATQPSAPAAAQQQAPATQQQAPAATQQQAPAATQQQQPAVRSTSPAAVAPPTQARDASEFMRRDGQGSGRRIDQLRQERREERQGDRVFIREPDRTIIREGNRIIIRHNEANRFAVGAGNVRTERRGANIETVVERRNGVRIVTVTDADGRLLRRVRRDPSGRELVIIDNTRAGPRAANIFVQLPPPVIRIPRERYVVEAWRARPDDIYEVFVAPPVERIGEVYTLDQVRYSAPLRDRMPRVDLDVTFDTGSWELSPEQIDKLAVIADGINRTVQRNPREVFLIEGHTDAVGQDVDNLSLSDRRAESVAVALTEQFRVPPENLVTQGYGEQHLKVPTEGPERANRRVSVRRITPLLDRQAGAAPPPPRR